MQDAGCRMQELKRQAGAEVWAILPSALERMLTAPSPLAPLPESGEGDRPSPRPSPSDGEGVVAMTRPGPKSGRVARIPIVGTISRRDSMWSSMFGGASVERLTQQMREVAADDSISTVLLDIDSPGGTIDGVPELAAEVRRLRESKHVIAMANSMAASAAYWVASQADEIVAAPEALVGSIGVFIEHDDWSAAMEGAGIKTTYIKAGKYKTDGNPFEPLSDDARTHLQGLVDDAYDLFVADVAKGRGTSAATVRSGYGEGRVLMAKEAKAAGMIDRIAGYQETIGRLTGVKALTPDPLAEQETPSPPTPLPVGEGSIGNSLAAKRLRLDLLEKS
jgi:capsid assembly protease